MNKDARKRDIIIFGKSLSKREYMGGCRRFDGIGLGQLIDLIYDDFIDINECQENSSTTKEIYEFMKKYPEVKAHGYVISPDRDDYRVTLEGVDGSEVVYKSEQFLRDFTDLFHDADEFDISTAWCWYD